MGRVFIPPLTFGASTGVLGRSNIGLIGSAYGLFTFASSADNIGLLVVKFLTLFY